MNKKITTYQLSVTALMAAVMCILGPLSVPIGPVPISLTNLVIYLSVILLGTKFGTLSYLVYLIIGATGLPVFSGFQGGLGKLAGPTGGYLIGFIFMALITGAFMYYSKGKPLFIVIGMVLGTLVDYLFGTIWFCIVMKTDFISALAVCVIPFLIGDAIKIALSGTVGILIRSRLSKLGLITNKTELKKA